MKSEKQCFAEKLGKGEDGEGDCRVEGGREERASLTGVCMLRKLDLQWPRRKGGMARRRFAARTRKTTRKVKTFEWAKQTNKRRREAELQGCRAVWRRMEDVPVGKSKSKTRSRSNANNAHSQESKSAAQLPSGLSESMSRRYQCRYQWPFSGDLHAHPGLGWPEYGGVLSATSRVVGFLE